MLHWDLKTKAIVGVAAFAIYFALAGWAKVTYVDPAPTGKFVIQLERPFERFGEFGVTSYEAGKHQELAAAGDFDPIPRSPLLLYENRKLLGPAHSKGEDIAQIGQGRYMHTRKGLIFSASDNSDVNKNGRTYWAVLPN